MLLWGKRTGMRDLLGAFAEFDERIAPAAKGFLETASALP